MFAFEVFADQLRELRIRIVLDRLAVEEVMVLRHRDVVVALPGVGVIDERQNVCRTETVQNPIDGRNGHLLVAGLDPFDDILHRGVAQLLHRLVDLAALRGQLQPRLLDSLQSFVVHRFVSFSGANIMQIIRNCKYFAFIFSDLG